MPNATVEPLNNNETSTMPGPSKKRRHENKADSITKDASTAAKRLSRKCVAVSQRYESPSADPTLNGLFLSQIEYGQCVAHYC